MVEPGAEEVRLLATRAGGTAMAEVLSDVFKSVPVDDLLSTPPLDIDWNRLEASILGSVEEELTESCKGLDVVELLWV